MTLLRDALVIVLGALVLIGSRITVDARSTGPLIPRSQRQVATLLSTPGSVLTAAVWSTQSCRLFYMVNDTTHSYINALQVVSATDDLKSKTAVTTMVLGPASGGIVYGISYTLNSNINSASYLLRSFALVESSSQDDLYFPDYALLRKYSFAAGKGCSGSCGTCVGGSYTDAATASTISNGTTRYGLLPDSYALAVRASTGDVFGPAYNYVYQVTSNLVFYYVSSALAGAPTATGMYTATTRWAAKLSQPYTIVIYNDATMFISDPPFGTVWNVDLGSGAFVAVVGTGTSTNSTCNATCATQNSGFSLWAPTAMAVYSGGDFSGPTLYIFESKNYVIWAYSITQALITPVVGTAARTGSTNGAALGGATLGAVSSLTTTSIALVIVEPHTIRYVNIRRPTTATQSLSRSNEQTESRSVSLTSKTKSVSRHLPRTTAPPTTTAAPTTTSAPTTTAAPTTTSAPTTTGVPTTTTSVASSTDVPTTTAAPNTTAPTTTLATTTTVAPSTTVVPSTTVITTTPVPTPVPVPPLYTCRTPPISVTAAAGNTEALLALATEGSSIDANTVQSSPWGVLVRVGNAVNATRSSPSATPTPANTTTAPTTATSAPISTNATNSTPNATTTTVAPPLTPAPTSTRLEFTATAILVTTAGMTTSYASGTGSTMLSFYGANPPAWRYDVVNRTAYALYTQQGQYDNGGADVATITIPVSAMLCYFSDGSTMQPTEALTGSWTVAPFQSAGIIDQANAAASSAAISAAVVNPAAAAGAQAIVAVSLLACASPAQKRLSSGVRLISPLATAGDSFAWMGASNALILWAVALIVGGTVFFLSNYDDMMRCFVGDNVKLLAHQLQCEPWEIVAVKLHFPSMIFTTGQFLLQGMVIGVVAGCFAAESEPKQWIQIGFAAFTIVCLITGFVMVHLMNHERLRFVPFPHREDVITVFRWSIPEKTWEPETVRRTYAFVVSQMREVTGHSNGKQMILRMHQPLLLILVSTSISVTPPVGYCVTQAAVVAGVYFIAGVLVLLSRPYRRGLYNVTFGGSYISNGITFIGVALTFHDSSSIPGARATAAGAGLQAFFSVMSVLYTVIFTIAEIFLVSGIHQVGIRAKLRSIFGKSDADDKLLDVPTLMDETLLETPTYDSALANQLQSLEAEEVVEEDEATVINSSPLLQKLLLGNLAAGAAASPPEERVVVLSTELERASGIAFTRGPNAEPQGDVGGVAPRVYRGDVLDPSTGSVVQPSSPPRKKKGIHFIDIPDFVTSGLLVPPPPPPAPPVIPAPLTASQARKLGAPPPPPNPPPRSSTATPPPPPRVKHALTVQLGDLGQDALIACAQLAQLRGATPLAILVAAQHIAESVGPYADRGAAVVAVQKVVTDRAAKSLQPDLVEIEELDVETLSALREISTSVMRPPEDVLRHIQMQELKLLGADPSALDLASATSLMNGIGRSLCRTAVFKRLAEARVRERGPVYTNIARGVSQASVLNDSSSGMADPLARLVAMQSGSLKNPDELSAAAAAGSTTTAALLDMGTTRRELMPVSMQLGPLPSLDKHASPQKSSSEERASSRSASVNGGAVAPFVSIRTVAPVNDSVHPPSQYVKDGAQRAVSIVAQFAEKRYQQLQQHSSGSPQGSRYPANAPPPPGHVTSRLIRRPVGSSRPPTDEEEMEDLARYL